METLRYLQPSFAHCLLRNHADIGHEPLNVLLYLYDVTAILRSIDPPNDDIARVPANLQRRPNALAHDVDPSALTPSNRQVNEEWRDWLDYAYETYFVAPDAGRDTLWQSPFAVPAEITAALLAWQIPASRSVSLWTDEAKHAVHLSVNAALAYFKSRRDVLDQFRQQYPVDYVEEAPDVTIAEQCGDLISPPRLPLAKPDRKLQQSIRDALAEARHGSSGASDMRGGNANTFRWILCALFEHAFDSKVISQSRDASGATIYAADAADHEAVCNFFPAADEMLDAFGDLADSPTQPRAGTAAALKAHQVQLQKRDAKLTAFFGEAVNTRRTGDSPIGHRFTRSETLYFGSSSTGEPVMGRRRAYSNGSSDATSPAPTPRRAHRSSTISADDRSSVAYSSMSHVYSPSVMSYSSSMPLVPRVSDAPEYTRKAPPPLSIAASPLTNTASEAKPFSDCLPIAHQAMPPTANALSLDQRRDLVKRSRKLQAMLGATLDESAAEYTLVQNVRTPHANVSDPPPVSPTLLRQESDPQDRATRRSSYPPRSPTSPLRRPSSATLRSPHDALGPSRATAFSPQSMVSTSSSSGDEAAVTSPETGLDTPDTYDAAQPWGHALYGLGLADPEARAKEARRRRVAKLQRFLGERIPVELAFAPPPPTFSHQRTSSRFGYAFQRASSKLGIRSRSATPRSTSSSSAVEEDLLRSSEEEARGGSRARFGGVRAPRQTASGRLSSEQTIASIRRARKLEQFFGELPPQGPMPRSSTEPSSESDDDAISLEDDVRRTRISSISGRRDSVKALLHLHDNDPAALDDLAQALGETTDDEKRDAVSDDDDDGAGERAQMARLSGYSMSTAMRQSVLLGVASSEGYSAFEPEPISPFSNDSTGSDKRRSQRVSLSSDGQRHLARAAKLASIFGTTKGAVLKQVLEDLEAELDDSDASETERAEVRHGLNRLRAEALHDVQARGL